jgi:hypothetical protein
MQDGSEVSTPYLVTTTTKNHINKNNIIIGAPPWSWYDHVEGNITP